MVKIKVEVSSPYEVVIGENILPSAGKEILRAAPCRKYHIVTDDGVPEFYVSEVARGLTERGAKVSVQVIRRGERSKNLTTLGEILERSAAEDLTRGDGMVAVGGGVTGDITGLAAALYMRGIKYAQVPTTLLAAIDSSVGGKTAVDLSAGKNLAGAFWQPSVVVCDVKTFETLSLSDIRCGMGEGVKYGVLAGGELWEKIRTVYLDGEQKRLISRKNGQISPFDLVAFTAECVAVKAKVVSADEREGNYRKILNLGHSVGHAIEKLGEYRIPHGECVAKGLIKITQAFPEYFGDDVKKALPDIFSSLGIDVSCPYSAEQLVSAMKADKKSKGESLSLVFASSAGEPFVKDVPFCEIARRL
ncbi:MAG: 3-dehydroquinate synthase [Clostridia bacterium]|nr:3-dehydroquinate synthase [Clostridia bacterium]